MTARMSSPLSVLGEPLVGVELLAAADARSVRALTGNPDDTRVIARFTWHRSATDVKEGASAPPAVEDAAAWSLIPGATRPTYRCVAADAGRWLRVTVVPLLTSAAGLAAAAAGGPDGRAAAVIALGQAANRPLLRAVTGPISHQPSPDPDPALLQEPQPQPSRVVVEGQYTAVAEGSNRLMVRLNPSHLVTGDGARQSLQHQANAELEQVGSPPPMPSQEQVTLPATGYMAAGGTRRHASPDLMAERPRGDPWSAQLEPKPQPQTQLLDKHKTEHPAASSQALYQQPHHQNQHRNQQAGASPDVTAAMAGGMGGGLPPPRTRHSTSSPRAPVPPMSWRQDREPSLPVLVAQQGMTHHYALSQLQHWSAASRQPVAVAPAAAPPDEFDNFMRFAQAAGPGADPWLDGASGSITQVAPQGNDGRSLPMQPGWRGFPVEAGSGQHGFSQAAQEMTRSPTRADTMCAPMPVRLPQPQPVSSAATAGVAYYEEGRGGPSPVPPQRLEHAFQAMHLAVEDDVRTSSLRGRLAEWQAGVALRGPSSGAGSGSSAGAGSGSLREALEQLLAQHQEVVQQVTMDNVLTQRPVLPVPAMPAEPDRYHHHMLVSERSMPPTLPVASGAGASQPFREATALPPSALGRQQQQSRLDQNYITAAWASSNTSHGSEASSLSLANPMGLGYNGPGDYGGRTNDSTSAGEAFRTRGQLPGFVGQSYLDNTATRDAGGALPRGRAAGGIVESELGGEYLVQVLRHAQLEADAEAAGAGVVPDGGIGTGPAVQWGRLGGDGMTSGGRAPTAAVRLAGSHFSPVASSKAPDIEDLLPQAAVVAKAAAAGAVEDTVGRGGNDASVEPLGSQRSTGPATTPSSLHDMRSMNDALMRQLAESTRLQMQMQKALDAAMEQLLSLHSNEQQQRHGPQQQQASHRSHRAAESSQSATAAAPRTEPASPSLSSPLRPGRQQTLVANAGGHEASASAGTGVSPPAAAAASYLGIAAAAVPARPAVSTHERSPIRAPEDPTVAARTRADGSPHVMHRPSKSPNAGPGMGAGTYNTAAHESGAYGAGPGASATAGVGASTWATAVAGGTSRAGPTSGAGVESTAGAGPMAAPGMGASAGITDGLGSAAAADVGVSTGGAPPVSWDPPDAAAAAALRSLVQRHHLRWRAKKAKLKEQAEAWQYTAWRYATAWKKARSMLQAMAAAQDDAAAAAAPMTEDITQRRAHQPPQARTPPRAFRPLAPETTGNAAQPDRNMRGPAAAESGQLGPPGVVAGIAAALQRREPRSRQPLDSARAAAMQTDAHAYAARPKVGATSVAIPTRVDEMTRGVTGYSGKVSSGRAGRDVRSSPLKVRSRAHRKRFTLAPDDAGALCEQQEDKSPLGAKSPVNGIPISDVVVEFHLKQYPGDGATVGPTTYDTGPDLGRLRDQGSRGRSAGRVYEGSGNVPAPERVEVAAHWPATLRSGADVARSRSTSPTVGRPPWRITGNTTCSPSGARISRSRHDPIACGQEEPPSFGWPYYPPEPPQPFQQLKPPAVPYRDPEGWWHYPDGWLDIYQRPPHMLVQHANTRTQQRHHHRYPDSHGSAAPNEMAATFQPT